MFLLKESALATVLLFGYVLGADLVEYRCADKTKCTQDNNCPAIKCTYNGTSVGCCAGTACPNKDITIGKYSTKTTCAECDAIANINNCNSTSCCDGLFCNPETTELDTGTDFSCRTCISDGQETTYTVDSQCCFGLNKLNDIETNTTSICRQSGLQEACRAGSCNGAGGANYCFAPDPYPHIVNNSDPSETGLCASCLPTNTTCNGANLSKASPCCDYNICQSPTEGGSAEGICRCSRTNMDICEGYTQELNSCCDKTDVYCATTSDDGLKSVNGAQGFCQGCREVGKSCYSGDGGVPCCGAGSACASPNDPLAIAPDYVQGTCVGCLALAAQCEDAGVPCCSVLGVTSGECGLNLDISADIPVCLPAV